MDEVFSNDPIGLLLFDGPDSEEAMSRPEVMSWIAGIMEDPQGAERVLELEDGGEIEFVPLLGRDFALFGGHVVNISHEDDDDFDFGFQVHDGD